MVCELKGKVPRVANSEVLSTCLMRVRDSDSRHLHYLKSAKRHKVRLP